MQQKFFSTPFALSGDRQTPPTAQQPDGSVSFVQGFGPDYEADPATNPNAKPVPREETNGLFHDLSSAVGALQRVGAPEYITAADNGGAPFAYARGARVRFGDPMRTFVSRVDNNTADPTVGGNWAPDVFELATTEQALAGASNAVLITPSTLAAAIAAAGGGGGTTQQATTSVAGITRYATASETQSGSISNAAVTPSGLASLTATTTRAGLTRYATNTEAAAGSRADCAVTPAGVAAAIAASGGGGSGGGVPQASTTVSGIQRNATNSEAVAGTLTDATVTPSGLTAAVASQVPTASTTVLGRVRLATGPEFNAGTAGEIVATIAQLRPALNGKQDNLGFIPIQQGGGSGQQGNKVYIGWTGSKLSAQVDTNNLGALATESWATGLLNAKAPIASPTFTGAATAAGAMVSQSARFVGNAGGVVLAAAANGGAVALRPNGPESTSGEARVAANGAFSAPGGFDTGSSRTIKHDISPIRYGLSEVEALQAVSYIYDEDYNPDGRTRLGFIAEDVRELMAEPVSDTPEGYASPLHLQHDQLLPVLWRAVQELSARLAALEGR